MTVLNIQVMVSLLHVYRFLLHCDQRNVMGGGDRSFLVSLEFCEWFGVLLYFSLVPLSKSVQSYVRIGGRTRSLGSIKFVINNSYSSHFVHWQCSQASVEMHKHHKVALSVVMVCLGCMLE